MYHREGDKAKLKQQRTGEAIALAMQGRWEEAAMANRAIVELFPTDIDAYNRLGRALAELGRYAEAREAYSHALELDHNNSIAQKNLHRLSVLADQHLSPESGSHRVPLHLFIGEAGKVGIVSLCHLASPEVLAKMSTGKQVYLRVEGNKLVVETEDGEYLGQVEPRHGLRLAKLIEGGNKYAAAVANLKENEVRVIIREAFQHPSQVGRPSFPSPKEQENFRAYARQSLLKYELEGESTESYPAEEPEMLVDEIVDNDDFTSEDEFDE